jgi:hypothetical protein
MRAKVLTIEQIRNCKGREYNPRVWDNNIDRMAKYTDVVFYHVPRGDGYEYDRYFVEYTLPDGLRLFTSFGYSSTMTSGGFYRLEKFPVTANGETYLDFVRYCNDRNKDKVSALSTELENASYFDISFKKFRLEDGREFTIGNDKKSREWMCLRSKKGVTFTKGN